MKGTINSLGMRAQLSYATAFLSALALVSLVLLLIFSAHNSQYRKDQADLRMLAADLTAMDLDGLAVNLAAMDAIVDKESGAVDPELIAEIDQAEANLKNLPARLHRTLP